MLFEFSFGLDTLAAYCGGFRVFAVGFCWLFVV